MNASNPTPKLLTTKETAEILRLSESGLRKLVRQGKVPHIRLGPRTIRFEMKAIESWLNLFFEISGDQTNVANTEAGMQVLAVPMRCEREEVDSFNRMHEPGQSRSQSAKAKKIGRVASKTAERLLSIEERNREGS